MKGLKNFLLKYCPGLIFLGRIILDTKENKIKRRYVLDNFKNNQEPEIQHAIQYLKIRPYSSFPYFWSLKYENYSPQVFYDTDSGFLYINFNGKRLYFPKSFTSQQVIWTTRSILREQDTQSAHAYLTKEFEVSNNSILIDAGVAEGSFSLDHIDKVKNLYLIECSSIWIEALKLTFEPWKDKVVIIEKYLSDETDGENIAIDDFIKPTDVDSYFIKMDIEGYEMKALSGMKRLISQSNTTKMAVCTYHCQHDASEIGSFMEQNGFKYHFSDGYLLFNNNNEPPSFRKALVRAEKS